MFWDKQVIPNIIVIWSFLHISLTYRQWQDMETLPGQGWGRERGRGRGRGRGCAQRYVHLPNIEARVEPEGLKGYASNVPPVSQPQPTAAPDAYMLELICLLQRQLDDQSRRIVQLATNGARALGPEDWASPPERTTSSTSWASVALGVRLQIFLLSLHD